MWITTNIHYAINNKNYVEIGKIHFTKIINMYKTDEENVFADE